MQMSDWQNAEHYRWGEVCDGWHLLRREDLSVIQERVPPGAGEVRHAHRAARQFFYILQGEASIEFDEKVLTLKQGQGVEVPPGVAHRFANRSAEDVLFLVISSPSAHGDRITMASP